MFNYNDFMQAANRTQVSIPEANIVTRPEDNKVVMFYDWITIVFTPSIAKPETDIIMDIGIHIDKNGKSFSADVHLEDVYKSQPGMVGNIAKNVFLQVTTGYLEQGILDKMADFIDTLFLGIARGEGICESETFKNLTKSIIALNTDSEVVNIVSSGITKAACGQTNMLYVTYVIPDKVPRLSLSISECWGVRNPRLKIGLNWITVTNRESDFQTWYIKNWEMIDPVALIQSIMATTIVHASSTLPDDTYDGIVTVLEKLIKIHNSK